MRMNASKAAAIMSGKTKDMPEDLVFTGASTDTRTISKGNIFFAIKGENFDGADYVMQAFEKGAACAVTERKFSDPRIILVEDVIKALGKLAKYHRGQNKIPVIAITGSVGKTTVKNMLISVLSGKYSVHSTRGNKNNHIGLPMMLMNLNKKHGISVLEMGMSGLGEIDYLSSIARPDYAIITNIGMSHIGMLGSRMNILKAKSEIMNHLRPGGTVLVNGDDDLLENLSVPDGTKLLKYGIGNDNNFIADYIETDKNGNCKFRSNGTEFKLPVPGVHNAVNAMAAVAMARILGIDENFIKEGLQNFKQSKMRIHRFVKDGVSYINDAYNANPQSMRAALDILKKAGGRKIAALGDMLEMGGFSQEEHIKLGGYAADCADILIFCGNEAGNMRKGALESGAECVVYTIETSGEGAGLLENTVAPGDTVLVKGSRGMQMENMLEYTNDGGKK
jgi:UDP-N-acetylmuramoyl-tripeptide--D-alanyl-D-alanine ligase